MKMLLLSLVVGIPYLAHASLTLSSLQLKQIIVAPNKDQSLELIALGQDGSVYRKRQHVPNGGWTNWAELGGTGILQLTIGRNADGRLELFALGGDRAVYQMWQTTPNGDWSTWGYVGGQDIQQILVGSNADGRLQLFAIGGDRAVYTMSQIVANGAWDSWSGLGGQEIQQIALGSNADGRLELFAIGGDHAVYNMWQTIPGGDWSGWRPLGGQGIQQIVLGYNADARMELFALGDDRAIYNKWQLSPNGGWSEWSGLGGQEIQSITVGRNADGRLELFAIGGDRAVYHVWQANPNGGWGSWSALGGQEIQHIVIGTNADGRLELFAIGGDHALYHCFQTAPNAGWDSWRIPGSNFMSKIVRGSNSNAWIECQNVVCLTPEWQSVNFARGKGVELCFKEYTTSDHPITIEGIVHDAHISSSDNWAVHRSIDYCADIEPDFLYQSCLAHCNRTITTPRLTDSNGEIVESHEAKIIEIEWETGDLPEIFRPLDNDRAWMTGRWVYDMGHAPNATEIHPPHAVAFTRISENSGNELSSRTTFVYVYGCCVGVVRGDPWISSYYSISDYNLDAFAIDYNFNIYLPPKPSEGATLNSIIIEKPFGGPDPILEFHPEGGVVNVTLPLKDFLRNSPGAKYGLILRSSWSL